MGQGAVVGGNVYRVTVYVSAANQHAQTSFHLRDVGLGTETASLVVDAVWPWVDTKYRTVMSSNTSIDRIEAVKLDTKEFAQKELIGQLGTSPGPLGNTMEAALISLRTKSRQRWLNGRMFWPTMLRNSVTNGVFEPGVMASLTAVAADFADRWTGSLLTHNLISCVVSKARPATPSRPAIPYQYTDTEVVKVNALASVQRRRKIGVGS